MKTTLACSRTSGRDRRSFFSPEKVCWIESKRSRRPRDDLISVRKCGSGAWFSMSKPGGGASSRLHFSESREDTSLDQIALVGRTRQDAALQAHREDYFNFLLQSTPLFLRKNPTSPTSKPSRMRAYPTESMMRSVVAERSAKTQLTGDPAAWPVVMESISKPGSRISMPKWNHLI